MRRGGIAGPVCEDNERRRADWTRDRLRLGIITFGFCTLVMRGNGVHFNQRCLTDQPVGGELVERRRQLP